MKRTRKDGVSYSAGTADRNVLREKARKMAEQLAGFLF
jgi:hypothetical protein